MNDPQVLHNTQQSSVEVTTTAKGEPIVTVKVYNDNAETAATAAGHLYNRVVGMVSKKTDALTGEVLVKPPAITPSSSSA